MTVQSQRAGRAPVTTGTVVAAARGLLARGGLEQVTIRDIAKELGVTSPALYKHLSGRSEIVDLLAAECLDELTGLVVQARDAAQATDHRGRMLAASTAWAAWAHAHPAEHALLFATPVTPFDRSQGGRSRRAGLRLGGAFLEILAAAGAAGRLAGSRDVPASVAVQLRRWADLRDLRLGDEELLTAVRGFQDLMGLIMTESFGQLGFALTDTDDYMQARLRTLVHGLIMDA